MSYMFNWNIGTGTVQVADNYIVTLKDKPDLSFDYDIIIYETPTDIKLKVVGGESFSLTSEEEEELVTWISSFINNGMYPVQVVKSGKNVYVKTVTKADAIEAGDEYVETIAPDFPVAKWVDDHWERVAAAIGIAGFYILWPGQDDERYNLYFTKSEWDEFPHPVIHHSRWNYETEQWEDARDLNQIKEDAIQVIHFSFVSERGMVSDDVPSIEMQTWTRQSYEASMYMKEKDLPPSEQTPTPFLDSMLATLKGTGVTKYALASSIIAHSNDEYWSNVGEVHGRMYKIILAIRSASTLEEVDSIMHDASLNVSVNWNQTFTEK